MGVARQKCHAKGRRKAAKIQEFCKEIRRMWNKMCVIIPVIT